VRPKASGAGLICRTVTRTGRPRN